jgi:tetratricopeptide (TPR) repeat protein
MIVPAGDIKDMTVARLFQDLRKEARSGSVLFAREQTVKKVYIKGGEIIYADSNLEDDQLGACLLRDGKITKQYFDATTEIVQKTGKALGAVLVEYDFLSPQDLVAGTRLQVKQIVLSVFGWRDGRYTFDNSQLPIKKIIPLQMNTDDLIVEGIRGLDWQVVRKSLPSLKTVLRLPAAPSLIVQRAGLGQDCHTVLSLIDGRRSIEELCSLSGIGDFNTLKAVYLLLALDIIGKGAVKTGAEMRSSCSTFQNAASAREQKAPEQTAETSAQADAAPLSKHIIEQAYEALRHQDNYQVLGISPAATTPEIKKAYFKLAKVYHPDRHLEPEMAVLKEKFESLFTAIHGAYQMLSDPAKREEYDMIRTGRQRPAQYEENHPKEHGENYAEKTGQAAAYFNAGMNDFKIGNFWGAAESFASATRLDPVKSDYFYHYGVSLTHIPRRRHEAEENLKKAIGIDPLKPEYHLELGALYLHSGLKIKALDVYNDALRQNPASNEIREAIKAAGGAVQEKKEGEAGLFKKVFKDKK